MLSLNIQYSWRKKCKYKSIAKREKSHVSIVWRVIALGSLPYFGLFCLGDGGRLRPRQRRKSCCWKSEDLLLLP